MSRLAGCLPDTTCRGRRRQRHPKTRSGSIPAWKAVGGSHAGERRSATLHVRKKVNLPLVIEHSLLSGGAIYETTTIPAVQEGRGVIASGNSA